MRLLITGAWRGAQDHIPALAEAGHEIRFLQMEPDALPCADDWPEGVICNGLFLHHSIEKFRCLRYIQLTSAGLERVPTAYAAAHGITVKNARGVYSVPMAEFALCGVLRLYKQAAYFDEGQRSHRWERRRDLKELAGKTVCVVGCGSVGTACAERFRAFGCRVLGVDLAPREDKNYESIAPLSALNDVLAQSDVAVLTVPLTEDTRRLMDGGRFGIVKPGCVLVNIARGPVVDERALTEALRQGRLGGAVLDVFEDEPLGESELWDMPNVLISPHNSFVGDGNERRLSGVILENLRNFQKERD